MYRLKIKEIAQAQGLSQNKLSRIADLDVNVVRRVFRNPQEVIQTDTLDSFAKALKVDISSLIESIREDDQQ